MRRGVMSLPILEIDGGIVSSVDWNKAAIVRDSAFYDARMFFEN
jgi:hypothetical protein